MKKNILYLLLLTVICSTRQVSAQCELPQPFIGNTGGNMIVFFTSNAIGALPISSDSPFIVAISPSGLIVGSASVASTDLINGQQSVAIWGDDTSTPETDGLLAGDVATFQLVDGNSLFDLDLSFAGSNSYSNNGTVPVISASATLNCIDESIVSNCNLWFSHTQISLSDANISVILGPDFTSSLGVENPTLSPDMFEAPVNTGANMTVGINSTNFDSYVGGQIGAFYDLNGDGSLQCVGVESILTGFFGLALWGDDPSTPDTDGLPADAVPEFAVLHEGEIIFVDEVPEFSGYVTNGITTISEVNLSTSLPYVVAVNQDNLVVGSVEVTSGSESELFIYPDDSTTTDIDGAESGEIISLYFVQDSVIYSLESSITFQNGEIEDISQADNPSPYCFGIEPYGCMDLNALNYNPDANTDDGSCEDVVEGCIDEFAFNFSPNANTDNGTCIPVVNGCTDNGSEISGSGQVNDFDGDGLTAFNYNPDANIDDGSCISVETGCIDESAFNFSPTSNTDDGTCISVVNGCIDNGSEINGAGQVNDFDGDGLAAFNYNPLANTDDGSCTPIETGCMNENACNYNFTANTDTNNDICIYSTDLDECASCSGEQDGTGVIVDNDDDNDQVCNANEVTGCTDQTACNYDATPTTDTNNELCIYSIDLNECASCSGEQDGTGVIVDNDDDNDQVCNDDEVAGCTDSLACGDSFDPLATDDDGTCLSFDDCGVCDGNNDCAIFIQDEIQITVDETLVSDQQAFSENFENLMETQLGLTEGSVVVLSVNIDGSNTFEGSNRGVVNVIVDYTITITEEELSVSNFDPNLSFEEIEDQINLNIVSIETGPVFSNLVFIEGCTDSLSCNFNIQANIDDFNCINKISVECDECSGEQDGTGVLIQYDLDGDGICASLEIEGCTDNGLSINGFNQVNDLDGDGIPAVNYDPDATDDDGSCITQVLGCTNPDYLEYWSYDPDLDSETPSASVTNLDPIPNTNDGSCKNLIIYGCMDLNSFNYVDSANVDIPDGAEGACIPYSEGCSNPNACNFTSGVINVISLCDFPPINYFCDYLDGDEGDYIISCINDIDGDGICDENEIEGCITNSFACNYNLDATDIVPCEFPNQFYDCSNVCINDIDSDGICDENEIPGCTDELACNFDSNSTDDDGSCLNSEQYYDCDGLCLNDSNGNGTCDELEILGCMSNWADNYIDNATTDDGSCFLLGCNDPNYIEFDINVTQSNGSCSELVVLGCMDIIACNFNNQSNVSDGSCSYPELYQDCQGSCINGVDLQGNCIEVIIEGCLDEIACNYDSLANTDTSPSSCFYFTEYRDCNGDCYFDEDNDGICDQQEIFGCIDVNACNYNEAATETSRCLYPVEVYLDCENECINDSDGDGYCDEVDVPSCNDELADNYEPFTSEIDNSLCVYPSGCTNPDAVNYNPASTQDDGSCIFEILGCTDVLYLEYDPASNVNNPELCVNLVNEGCMNENASNYDPQANFNTYECEFETVYGCMSPDFLEYNPLAIEDSIPTLCQEIIVKGCTNPNFLDYDPSANVDNGTCQSLEYVGCADSTYQEYDPLFTVNDQDLCLTPHIYGCTSPLSQGGLYNSLATVDDGSCILIGCSNPIYAEYYTQGFIPNNSDDAVILQSFDALFCNELAVFGCVNDYANNYNPEANVSTDDCEYGESDNSDYYDFTFESTETSMSIILPYFLPSNSLSVSNVEFTGDVTEPFELGSTFGVFYRDHNLQLMCGGSSEWSDTTNYVSAFADDVYTETKKDGFYDGDVLEWYLVTPSGLLYGLNVEMVGVGSNTFSGGGFLVVDEIESQFIKQINVPGCMDSLYLQYNPYANVFEDFILNYSHIDSIPGLIDGSDNIDDDCINARQIGCMDPTAFNYRPNATEDDGSCYPIIYGCIDQSAFNYVQPIGNVFVDPNTNVSDGEPGSCFPIIEGCKDDNSAFNYIPLIGDPQKDVNTNIPNGESGACYSIVEGCNDFSAFNYNDYDGDGLANDITGIDSIDINTDDGSCIPKVYGCMSEGYSNFNPLANIDTEVCYPIISGCIEDDAALNYIEVTGNPYQDVNDFVPCVFELPGCMDSLAYNFNSLATSNDNSCISRIYGCVDESAFNFDVDANTDDGSCYPIIYGCMDESAFNFNNHGSDKFIGYDLTDEFTNVNTEDSSCIPINEGCLDVNAYNFNDFDLDGESNIDENSYDPYQKINSHRQSDCFYRPGCTDQNYAQYWNYSIEYNLDRIVYPDSMINFDESCIDIAEYFCDDPTFVEHYIVENNFISTYIMSTNDALVPKQTECINVRIDYCDDSNYEGYYFTDNILGGSDIDQGANFPISPAAQFYSQGNDLNPEDAQSLCGNPVSFYCNNSSFTGYFASDNSSLTMKDNVGGNIIDDSLCGEIPVELYCSDSSYVGYYNTNTDGIHDYALEYKTGNIDDQFTCGDLVDKYCNDPLYQGYYSTNTVENPYVGNLLHNEEVCGELATFYCGDPEYSGYYLEYDVDGQIASGSHIDNSTEYCKEPIETYCSDSTYFEYYIDYSESFDPYIGNVKDDSECQSLIYPGCMDETMFNYDAGANVNHSSVDDRMNPCYPIVYGCLDESAANFNNYYSSLNTNPQTGLPYDLGDLNLLTYGANVGQDSVFTNYYNNNIGNGINVNTPLPENTGSLYSGGCIPYVGGCLDQTALNYNDWFPEATDTTDYGDGLADNWNYNNPWLNINTDDGSCIPLVPGCTDLIACNYIEEANINDGTCVFPEAFYGCDGACVNDTDEDGICDELEILGCTDNGLLDNDFDNDQLAALNYNPLATDDDGLCITIIEGCMEEGNYNYDPEANFSGICVPFVQGCADSTKFNYDPTVNDTVNILCYDIVYGCMIEVAFNFNNYGINKLEGQELSGIDGLDVNTSDDSCIPYILGCLDSLAVNYIEPIGDPFVDVNTNNGSCIEYEVGCTDPTAANYNFNAISDDGSCRYQGCLDPGAFNYNPDFDTSCSDCCILSVTGCMNETAFNYDPTANIPSFCIDVVLGCMDNGLQENGLGQVNDADGDGLSALNYKPNANTPSDDCITKVFGCSNPEAIGYNEEANVDDGSCIIPVAGCTDSFAVNYEPFANQLDASCLYLGCTDQSSANWNSQANIDDGSCIASIIGCTDSTALNYNPLATIDNGNTCIAIINGCTNPLAYNFSPSANIDDGQCEAIIRGCTDPSKLNYNPDANTDISEGEPGACISIVVGCMYSGAMNYDPTATIDSSPTSCVLEVLGCTDAAAINFNQYATVNNNTCVYIEPIPGCMNQLACNYDLNATVPNGTCEPCKYGCNDPTALNYDQDVDSLVEGSCILPEYGCLSPLYLEFEPLANIDSVPSLCSSIVVYGCMDSEAANYNEAANINAISDDNPEDPCIEVVYGCTIQGMLCFDPNANTLDPESCFNCPDLRSTRSRSDTIIYCSNELADNYNIFFDSENDLWPFSQFNPANTQSNFDCTNDTLGYDIFCTDGDQGHYALKDEDCEYVEGCTDNGLSQNHAGEFNDIDEDGLPAFNYNDEAVIDDGSCKTIMVGCMDTTFLEYDSQVNIPSSTYCLTPKIYGCTDVNKFGFNPSANTDDGSCEDFEPGCLNDQYLEFETYYNTGDESVYCITPVVLGCTDTDYLEYWVYDLESFSIQSVDPIDSIPNTNDGSCFELVQLGCADSTYLEYWNYSNNTITPKDVVANVNDGSCSNLISEGCKDFLFVEYSSDNNVSDQSQCITPIVPGCTNDQYLEYDVSHNIGEDNVYCLTLIILGCTNANAQNYNDYDNDGIANELTGDSNIDINTDDGSCVGLSGCTDVSADNYDSNAAVDDGSCEYWGCTNENAANYDAAATENITSAEDSSSPCIVLGCTDSSALNYNDLDGDAVADSLTAIDGFDVNIDDGSCIYEYVYGCMDPDASNYNALATLNQFSEVDDSDPCIPYVYGCKDDSFVEYYDFVFSNELQYEISGPVNIPNQDTDPSSCLTSIIEGCTDASFLQYVDSANVYNASACIDSLVVGCQVETYLEYNPEANFGDENTYCLNIKVIGCMNPNYFEYSSDNNVSDNLQCLSLIVDGCTDNTAFNYNELANANDGSCIAIVNGCTDNGFGLNGSGQVDDIDGDGLPAFNYDSLANTDDGSCEAIVEGCTDANFIEHWIWDEVNFTITALDPIPNTDDGSCSIFRIEDCKDPLYIEYNDVANVSDLDSCINLIVEGCTDANFIENWAFDEVNFTITALDPVPNKDDGSCITEIVFGCTDSDSLEYYGFIDFIVPVDVEEYLTAVSDTDSIPNVDDESCATPIVQGCFNELASNHNPLVTVHDVSSCQGAFGCMLSDYKEYNELALIDNGSCLTEIEYGCIDDGSSQDGLDDYHYDLDGDGLPAYNYNTLANTNDSSCYPIIEGCFDVTAYNYNDYDDDDHPNELSGDVLVDINTNNSSYCIPRRVGCYSDSLAFNYNDYDNDGLANALVGDPSIDINTDSLGFCYPVVEGCMDDINAFNYNDYTGDDISDALTGFNGVDINTDDGSCFPFVIGCMDETAYNYNDYDGDGEPNELTNSDGVDVNTADDSCYPVVEGCLNDINAFNYNDYSGNDSSNVITGTPGIDVNTDDGSCFAVLEGCLDAAAYNYNDYDSDGLRNDLIGDLSVDINTHNLSLCEYEGCTNFSASNYDEAGYVLSSFGFLMPATIDDGSCHIPGCTLENFPNYNEEATIEDGSCDLNSFNVYGCTDENYLEYLIQGFTATVNNGSCLTPIVFGCIDDGSSPLDEIINFSGESGQDNFDDDYYFDLDGDLLPAFNFDSTANTNDGSCIPLIFGCTDQDYLEYSSEYNTQGSNECITPVILGCTEIDAQNYDSSANTDDGSCDKLGCIDENYLEYDSLATIDDGSCIEVKVFGCVNPNYLEYWEWELSSFNNQFYLILDPLNDNVNTDNGSCLTELVYGCIYSSYVDYNPSTNVPDIDSCQTLKIYGCTDESADNFNDYDGDGLANGITGIDSVDVNTDDGSCQISGCTNLLAFNYNENANVDNDSCVPFIYGCTMDIFNNYNSLANIDNGTCSNNDTLIIGCTNELYFEYDSNADSLNEDYCINLIIYGCMDDQMKNYDPTANFDDASCIPYIYGCTNDIYLEYNSIANTDDGSCYEFIIPGCSDPLAFNYNIVSDSTWLANNPNSSASQNVNLNDGSCIAVVLGCMNSDYLEYYNQDILANTGEDSIYCHTPVNSGCTDDMYLEYYKYFEVSDAVYIIEEPIDTTINYNDGSCATLIIEGCMYEVYQEYNPEANVSNTNQCDTLHIYGCMNPEADNFDSSATSDDGNCFVAVPGCMDDNYLEYDSLSTIDDGSCIEVKVFGCDNPNYLQYYSFSTEIGPNGILFNVGDPLNNGANVPDGCIDSLVYGCSYPDFVEYDSLANVYEFGVPSCQTFTVEGCTDETAVNFDAAANTDDASCIPTIYGCTDISYVEFNPFATIDDASCTNKIVLGCDDSSALNYNPFANTDDGSCEAIIEGCTDASAFNYDQTANVDNGLCFPIVEGCTDNGYGFNALGVFNDANNDSIAALNFNPEANTDDESCIPVIEGCLDIIAYNYNDYDNDGHPNAVTGDVLIDVNTENNTCIAVLDGCTDPSAFNYSIEANTDDGSCYPFKHGCLDETAYNYNDYDLDGEPNPWSEIDSLNINTDNGACIPILFGCIDCTEEDGTPIADNCEENITIANTDNETCQYFGCMDPTADNYDPIYNAPIEGACEIRGCISSDALNYNSDANYDDGSCEFLVFGCTDSLYMEYDSLANQSDGSCQILVRYGCTDATALNYDPSANTNQVSFEDSLSNPCISYIWGCTDNGLELNAIGEINDLDGDSLSAYNYNSVANSNDGSCITKVFGCMNPNATEESYNPAANMNDNSCELYIWGCTDTEAFNYNMSANTDDGSCLEILIGCMNPLAFNYDPLANSNSGACISYIYGCTDEAGLNYNANANEDDGSCIEVVSGCMNPVASNYNPQANSNDGSCVAVVYGCTDPSAVNYYSTATIDNGTCVELITGCTNPFASNFNNEANQDDGSCSFDVEGCTDESALNYNENATIDDGSCEDIILGCIWSFASNFNPEANTDDGSCDFSLLLVTRSRSVADVCIDPMASNYFDYANPVSPNYLGEEQLIIMGLVVNNESCTYAYGCTDPTAFNYDLTAEVDDGSCEPYIVGCMDESYMEYNVLANTSNSSYCLTLVVEGCNDINATNYDPLANTSDGTCIFESIEGCTDPAAINYNAIATISNGSCQYDNLNGCSDPNYIEYNTDEDCVTLIVSGCTDPVADNFDQEANTDNNNCQYEGCTDPSADNHNVSANIDDGSCIWEGCTTSTACNYDNEANLDDGSCNYAVLYYDCLGECLVDSDSDGTCDELEISGCMDASACNYNSAATDSDESCSYAENLYDCAGNCINDSDSDSVCDELEVEGCTDPLAYNYDLSATDESGCDYNGCMDSAYIEFDPMATIDVDNASCEVLIVSGCTNELANNYDSNANQDDGSCNILGCTEPAADNYNVLASQDDDSCIISGCTDQVMFNYNPLANQNDGSCVVVAEGCIDVNAFNFDASANTDDGSCIEVTEGCTDENSFNYDASANTDDGSCEVKIYGCTDVNGSNFNVSANTDDGSCVIIGCTNQTANNYNSAATQDDNPTLCLIPGCTLEFFDNYNSEATVDDGSCENNTGDIFGCTDSNYIEYDESATQENGSCDNLVVEGCIDIDAFNYNPNANTDDNSCYPVILGCLEDDADNYQELTGDVQNDVNTNNEAFCIYYGCVNDIFPNYNPVATTDDGSCSFSSEDVFGCIDSDYLEYVDSATVDNGTCATFIVDGCTDSNAYNYNSSANVDDGSCVAIVLGCTDPLYLEYDLDANVDDNSCSDLKIYGCTDTSYLEYWHYFIPSNSNYYSLGNPIDPGVNFDDNSCNTLLVFGCVYDIYVEYNSTANVIDLDSCITEVVQGCMSDWADNYNSSANTDDNSCYKEGCMSDWADNFDTLATSDNGSCYREGCTLDWADNFDTLATIDNDSCYREGCTLDWADNYDLLATQNTLTEDECYKMGCKWSQANNFDPDATTDNETCYREGCMSDWADNTDSYLNFNAPYPVEYIDDGSCTLNACMSDWADNFDSLATSDNDSCYREGCMSDWADNYDSLATQNTLPENVCYIMGCMSGWADNFDSLATIDNDSCYREGCTSDWADNYDSLATTDDGSCYRMGCLFEWAEGGNYDSLATINDGSCVLSGCMLEWADNYNSNANIDDGSCVKEGCMSDWADNYDAYATIEDGLCELNACMLEWADNYNSNATIDDGSCFKEGCISDWADNYDEYATIDDGLCELNACMSDWADNYDVNATSDTIDGSCQLLGCTDSVMFNYNSLATENDGSCYPVIEGCLDPDADNYFDLTGNIFTDPNTACDYCCLYYGCMDSLADNYDSIHNIDDNSCIYYGCIDSTACNYDDTASDDDGSCFISELYYNCSGLCINDVDADGVCDELEQYGCTDDLAVNYDVLATEDNALCYYPLQVDLVINNAVCKGSLGSVELNITGGLEPIEVNTFGLDTTAIPPGDGYVIHVSDASGNNYSLGGSDYNFTPSFSITEPQEQLQLIVEYDQVDDQIYFVTNADAPEFTWYFNNVADESINTDSFTPQENGVYGVDITDEFGCSLFEDVLFENVSVSELSVESLEVYPNPADGWVNIKYDLPKNISSTIRLISLAGKLVYEISLEANNRVEQSIPLFDISAGVYLVEIEVDDQKLYRRISIK